MTTAEVPGAINESKRREEARASIIEALDVLLTSDEELADGAPAEGSESTTNASDDDLTGARE